ncbi:MAG: SprT family zinc-dependent metalloprotease [Rhodocyclaceae bacterium]|nr:SprT family zinc-dependent metalloprotease [Rhodocyclaceae bacterium]
MSIVTHPTREAWLLAGVERIKPIFEARGHVVPPVRVSVGWSGSGQRALVAGECWPTARSADGINQIFIVPALDNAVQVLDVLTHELVHAVDDCVHSHGREFKAIALSVGLVGPRMRSASAGPALKARLTAIAAELGTWPHGALSRRAPRASNPNPPRAQCPQCDYRLAIPKKFLHLGPPICPEHQVRMESVGDWDGW